MKKILPLTGKPWGVKINLIILLTDCPKEMQGITISLTTDSILVKKAFSMSAVLHYAGRNGTEEMCPRCSDQICEPSIQAVISALCWGGHRQVATW